MNFYDFKVGQVVSFNGTKNTNPDHVPNGCVGTVKQLDPKNLKILVQWSGSSKGQTCWVFYTNIQ